MCTLHWEEVGERELPRFRDRLVYALPFGIYWGKVSSSAVLIEG